MRILNFLTTVIVTVFATLLVIAVGIAMICMHVNRHGVTPFKRRYR